MKTTAILLASIAVAGLMMVTAPQQADARPQYLKAFKKKYEDIADQAKNCGACHGGKNGANKKQLSEYGEALKEAIGKKNEKDEGKLNEAFDKAEEKKPEGGEKTYGEMIEDGKIPPPHKEEE